VAVTSGTYLFQNLPGDKYVIEAYERIGIKRNQIDELKVNAFINSANFILSDWVNNLGGLNLYTVKEAMIGLTQNRNSYNLPIGCIDILEATIRTSTRRLGGTPFSSAGGIASNAFDGNPNTACIQTAPNGYISYQWTASTYAISMVGIQSNVTIDYTLVFEYSNDGATWVQVGAPVDQTYTAGQISWFSISVPVPGTYFRVRETGGATLDVQELFFDNQVRDRTITRLSRAEYTAFQNKLQTGTVSSFIVYRNIPPFVVLWPTPNILNNCMYFTYECQIQDFGALVNTPEIPNRYMNAFMNGVAHQLALKENLPLDKVAYLESLADKSYSLAKTEDRERVPLRAYPDPYYGRGSI